MRSRPSPDDRVADLTRQRLETLIAELEAQRGVTPATPSAPTTTTPEPAPPAATPDPAVEPQPSVAGRHARQPLEGRARATGWLADRLPVSLGAQPHLGSAQVGLVAMVVAAGLVLAAWWLVRGRGADVDPVAVRPPAVAEPAGEAPGTPGPTASGDASAAGPLPVVPSAAPSAGPTNAGSGARSAAGQQIIVDVVGSVRRPGIAVLPAGARVIDAVEAAGGLRRGFPAASVNMARVLTDGEQVLVRRGAAASGPAIPAAPGASGAPEALVNLNTADQAALETLPGVGPVTAAAILEWRAEHGGFSAVEELLEVSGIGDATLAEIAPHVTL